VGEDDVEPLREGDPEVVLGINASHVDGDAIALQRRLDELGIADIVLEMQDPQRGRHARSTRAALGECGSTTAFPPRHPAPPPERRSPVRLRSNHQTPAGPMASHTAATRNTSDPGAHMMTPAIA